jgi:Flp pilus assembly protein TadD
VEERPQDIPGGSDESPERVSEDSKARDKEAPEAEEQDDDLEFVVTEARDTGPTFVGTDEDDDTTTQENVQANQKPADPTTDRQADSTPAEPTAAETDDDSLAITQDYVAMEDTQPNATDYQSSFGSSLDDDVIDGPAQESSSDPHRIEKLSEDQIREIKENLYRGSQKTRPMTSKSQQLPQSKQSASEYNEKSERKPSGFDSTPINPRAAKSSPVRQYPQPVESPTPAAEDRPQMAPRARSVAFYYKQWIQISRNFVLRDNDEMTINDRVFVLKRRRMSPRTMAMVLAPLAAIVFFIIGAMLTSDASGGNGRIIGVVLDNHEQPYLRGAQVSFPGLSKSYETNGQGFFKTDLFEAGSYKIEYGVGDNVIGTDFATVSDGEVTMLTLKLGDVSKLTSAAVRKPLRSSPPVESSRSQRSVEAETRSSNETATRQSTPTRQPSGETRTANTSTTAKIRLTANVSGARLSLDGQTIGAGNMVYSQIRPGRHSYSVAAEGYITKSGSVDLTAGRTTTLEIKLDKLAAAAKEKTYDQDDYYYSAKNAFEEGDNARAIEDLNRAIELKPAFASAYYLRGKVLTAEGRREEAHDDYLRSAEQYRVAGEYNRAITAFNQALEMDERSIPALLGRASTFLAKGENIAAITDYENVINLDNRNFDGYFGLGKARFEQGYYDKAIKHFRDARSIDSQNPQVYQYLMLSCFADDDPDGVMKAYEKFKQVASDQEMQRFLSDSRYAAVARVVKHMQ